MLKENTTYFYTYRHLFRDGHVSHTSQPIVIKTDTQKRRASMELAVVEDLDHTADDPKYARLEIYRKADSDSFRHIQTLNPNQLQVNGSGQKYVNFTDEGMLDGGE